jgi:hypothetical protein
MALSSVSKDGDCDAILSLFSSAVASRSCHPGAALSPAPRVDTALVKAVVRAHRWRQMLESGEYSSSAELAKAEKVHDPTGPYPPPDLIAPDITELSSWTPTQHASADDLLRPFQRRNDSAPSCVLQ